MRGRAGPRRGHRLYQQPPASGPLPTPPSLEALYHLPGDERAQADHSAHKRARSALAAMAVDVEQLSAGAVEVLPADGLAARLAEATRERRPLRVKLGIDPTAPGVHLGHAVALRKLRAFQDAGHRVVLIIGDFTARIGDPSGRSALRPQLTEAQIAAHAATYLDQAAKILRRDEELLEVRRNSEWLEMRSGELLALLRMATVAQLTERDDFARRLAAGQPLSLLELLYPLLQAYDSVAVRADVEIGGTDQKFNLLLGRDIQRAHGLPEQVIMTLPILIGVDGSRKMSKTLGNDIGLADPPDEIYGKTMSIPDHALDQYYRLLLSRELPAEASPLTAKRALARELVAWLYDAPAAERAEARFDRVFRERGIPEEIEEVSLPGAPDSAVHLPALLASTIDVSRSQARRLIDQGAVALDGEQLSAGCYDLPAEQLDGRVLQIGRRRFVRLRGA
ncbi:MAG TPA: tyrosine--tRNA ligase [Solirubrobacteraceae bacterium]|nr:tyrosine--tRNA ligase [Solirubrobacteraceae bacterium]